ncbi:MAG: DUF3616 domain-containing protein [Methylotetracoccus sp.]|nr:DUF3616 domain-containing protein [Methylotetracoccus sp.]
METITLEFGEEGKKIAESLSAFVRVDDSIFAGGDEGVNLARLEERDGGKRFELEKLIELSEWFDLPIPPPADRTKAKEIDLEGMDFDRRSQLLWLVGSHSLKRGKAEQELKPAKNLKELSEVKSDANRFFLGCVKLHKEGGTFRLSPDGPDAEDDRAAQLVGDATTSELLEEIRRDKLFARFCAKDGIPGKDNGVDIEGLACAPDGRVLVGMRGPVLRGIAVLLELAPRRVDSPGTKADRLQLTSIGPDGRKYRRHFLDLAGHGIRDLCWDGDDLLILAGPTMGLDAPPLVFRWKAAKAAFGKASSDEEQFFWRSEDALVLVPLGATGQPDVPGKDHAEAITWLDPQRLAIGYDSPNKKDENPRFDESTGTVAVDIVKL